MKRMDAARLVAAAMAARRRAYAPYSRYRVGAAVLGGSGRIYSGCNVENASYGLTICAERNAVFQAVAAGEKRILACAVAAAAGKPASPCGACRQVLREFGPEMPVYLVAAAGRWSLRKLSALLPDSFGPENLK